MDDVLNLEKAYSKFFSMASRRAAFIIDHFDPVRQIRRGFKKNVMHLIALT